MSYSIITLHINIFTNCFNKEFQELLLMIGVDEAIIYSRIELGNGGRGVGVF